MVKATKKTDNATADGREYLDLTVDEVSLVDSPAIRRRFPVVKRQRQIKKNDETTPDDEGTTTTDSTQTTDEVVVKGLTQEQVAKAYPILTALADEKLQAIGEKIAKIRTGLGTMSQQEACDLMWGLWSLYDSAYTSVMDVARAVGAENVIAVDVQKSIERVEKAHPKKMTSRRLTTLKGALTTLSGLAGEFESNDPDEEEETVNTAAESTVTSTQNVEKKEQPGGAAAPAAPATTTESVTKADVAEIVTKAVTAAMAPILERVTKLEQPAAAPVTTAPVTKADETPAWAKELLTKVEGVAKRVGVLEGEPAGTGENTTTESVVKAGGDPKPGSHAFWGGAGVTIPRS